ncbi:hypothetical protein QN277_002998 [Acacia crassicarpa]|uniref:GATA-type domain-containing protein n=2 Tax=Acacia crassicarpa TaxID=499986 RepID=A0AAE1TIF0_9FABA|nr:hypothetical protein QN277_002998 [Acacia crassicarpa]
MSEDITNMKDPLFLDKSFNGLPDEIFDDVIKFFDFPLEDVDANIAEEEDWDAQFKRIEEPSFDVFSVSSSELSGKTQNDNLHLGNGRTSSACKETSAPVAKPNIYLKKKDQPQFRTYSPVSVFESTTSSSGESSNFELPIIPGKRPRGRRRRLSSFTSLLPIRLALRKSQKGAAAVELLNGVKRKQRTKDLSILSSEVKMKKSSLRDSGAPTKCMHCEATKTPQWREGPMGPKTLCNACGVRYRSGRLFPEYRPAASPTFVPSLHSNSHKKVIEMRNSVMQESGASILGLSSI